MSLSYLEVVRVMCRSDLNSTCTNLHIGMLISYDRDFSVCKRKLDILSDEILISRILRVNGNRCITKHGLRSCCGDLDKSAFLSCDRVIDMPEMSFLLLMDNLGIGK